MTLTEIAILRLPPAEADSLNDPQSRVRELLLQGKRAMEDYKLSNTSQPSPHSPHSILIGRKGRDEVGLRNMILIIGNWKDLSQHVDGFVPTETNQTIMKRLTEFGVAVEYFGHFQLAGHISINGQSTDAHLSYLDLYIAPLESDDVRGAPDSKKKVNEICQRNLGVASGWRVDAPDGEHHYAMLRGLATRDSTCEVFDEYSDLLTRFGFSSATLSGRFEALDEEDKDAVSSWNAM